MDWGERERERETAEKVDRKTRERSRTSEHSENDREELSQS